MSGPDDTTTGWPPAAATDGQTRLIQNLLACPRCHQRPLSVTDSHVLCPRCGWERSRQGRILSVLDDAPLASFDVKHDMVEGHNHHPVVWQLCYQRQCHAITAALYPGHVVLDLGCGPAVPYEKPSGVYLVGVDPSLPSLAANGDVDLALHTTGAHLPLGDATVDVIVANYALHHMVGATVLESWHNVEAAFAEMARVARPGAEILALEICPWAPVWAAERVGWRLARRLAEAQVDFLFWPVKAFEELGERALPGARFEQQRFGAPLFAMFPPVIGIPRLRIPWLLYPFDVCLLRWKLDGASGS